MNEVFKLSDVDLVKRKVHFKSLKSNTIFVSSCLNFCPRLIISNNGST